MIRGRFADDLARIMPLYNSDSHSRHPNVCNEQPFLSHTMCDMSDVIDRYLRLIPTIYQV